MTRHTLRESTWCVRAKFTFQKWNPWCTDESIASTNQADIFWIRRGLGEHKGAWKWSPEEEEGPANIEGAVVRTAQGHEKRRDLRREEGSGERTEHQTDKTNLERRNEPNRKNTTRQAEHMRKEESSDARKTRRATARIMPHGRKSTCSLTGFETQEVALNRVPVPEAGMPGAVGEVQAFFFAMRLITHVKDHNFQLEDGETAVVELQRTGWLKAYKCSSTKTM